MKAVLEGGGETSGSLLYYFRALISQAEQVGSYGMLNKLGGYLEVGHHMEQDVGLAAGCYGTAAIGDSEGQANYGFCLEHGLGVERDVLKSVEMYEKSMIDNNPKGQGHYTLSLHFGTGLDLEYAADHYEVVMQGNGRFVRDNSSRCYRRLNRK